MALRNPHDRFGKVMVKNLSERFIEFDRHGTYKRYRTQIEYSILTA